MARTALNREVHTDDIKIEQKPDLNIDAGEREPEIIVAHNMPEKAYADELAFNEEPVTIRLEPSSEKNAPTAYPIWVNGKGCEVWSEQHNRWLEMIYIPVGVIITTKRKYVEVMVRAKLDRVETEVREPESENPNNIVKRFTSAVHSFSIIEDRNPKGVDWLTELRRRNF